MEDNVETESNEPEVDFMSELNQLYAEKVQYGPKVDEQLAVLSSKAMENPLSDDQLKGLSEKYAVLENCSKLQVIIDTCNKELWTAFKGS